MVEKSNNKVVLFDDVLTSGSQMIAAERLLTEQGHAPIFGVVGARATKQQFERMINWNVENLQLDCEESDWDEIKF